MKYTNKRVFIAECERILLTHRINNYIIYSYRITSVKQGVVFNLKVKHDTVLIKVSSANGLYPLVSRKELVSLLERLLTEGILTKYQDKTSTALKITYRTLVDKSC